MPAKVPSSNNLLRFFTLFSALYGSVALLLLGVLPVHAQRLRPANPPAISQPLPLPSLEQQLSRRLPALIPGQTAIAGDLLVGLQEGANEPAFATRLRALGQVIGYSPALRTLRIKLNPTISDNQALTWLRQQNETAYAENNHRIQVTSTPNDASYAVQWALPKIQADQAWDIWKPQGQVVLAIIDTGVDYTHPDLANVIFRDTVGNVVGHDSTGAGTFLDGYGHGTHVSGSAAAQINNGVSYQYTDGNNVVHTFGTAGAVGWNGNANQSNTSHIKIMPIRVLDNSGSGTDAGVADGIAWAADHGAQVISMSLGAPEDPNDPGPPATLNAAVQYAWSKGVVIVAAAGNDGSTGYFYPAACPNVISVAATDPSDTLASFSNFGNWVNVAAPGVSIYSTVPSYSTNGNPAAYYSYSSGTSMAAPHVAAEAAMLRAQKLTLTNQQVRDLIIGNVNPLNGGRTINGGSGGRVNFYSALSALSIPSDSSVRINSGGTAAGTFASDQDYNGGFAYSTSATIDTSGVNNPAPQACYQTLRYITSGSLSYAVPNLTPGSSYMVRLHFAEVAYTAAGQRVMNISLNGSAVQNNFDLVAEAGGRYKAIVKEFTATADNGGKITVSLGRVQGDPFLNALEVVTTNPVANTNYRINSGGTAAGTFAPDQYYSGGVTYATSTVIDTSGVNNPAPQACYQTLRYITSGSLSYAVPNLTPGSSYTVRLHFAEVAYTAAGQRVMNISLNGNVAQNNFDLVAEAGGRYKAIVKEFTATADSNGTITISLGRVQGDPFLNALEILQAGSGGPASGPPPTIPAAPTNLTATGGSNAITLAWTASPGATSYNIKRSTVNGGPYITVATLIDSTSFVDGGQNFSSSYNLSANTRYYYVVTAMNAAGESPSSSQASAVTTTTPTTSAIQINCGGSGVGTFAPDQDYNGGFAYSTGTVMDTSGVSNPAPQACYQSVRYTTSGPLTYAVPNLTPGSSYTVRLHFAEVYWTAAGQRVMNISINGSAVQNNFDLVAEAGGRYKAIVKEFTATADSNGTITISLGRVQGDPDLNALEIVTANTGPVTNYRINSGGYAVGVFSADQYYTTTGLTYSTGTVMDTSGVSNPAPQACYQSVRYTTSGPLTYAVPNLTPGSSYTVRLHFAEVYWTAAGQRVMNISINGSAVQNNFDLVAEAGGRYKAIVKEFTATADSNGTITISLGRVQGDPDLNALEILKQ